MSTDESTPRVVVASVIPAGRRWGRRVTVLCPFCGYEHVHGWPEGDPEPGYRLSHCAPARRLRGVTPETPRDRQTGYWNFPARPYRVVIA